MLLTSIHASLLWMSANFCRVFTFRFSFWALFDTQLINFISMVSLIIQDLRSKFTTQKVNIVFTLKIRELQTAQLEWWDWRTSINLHRTMNNILMTFQSRSAKSIPQISTRVVNQNLLLLTNLNVMVIFEFHGCAFCFCLGVSRPFASDTSPKWIDR